MDRRIIAYGLTGLLGLSQVIPASREFTYRLLGAQSARPAVERTVGSTSVPGVAPAVAAPRIDSALTSLDGTIREIDDRAMSSRDDGILSNEEAEQGACTTAYLNASAKVERNLSELSRDLYRILENANDRPDVQAACLNTIANDVGSDGVQDTDETTIIGRLRSYANVPEVASQLTDYAAQLYGVDR